MSSEEGTEIEKGQEKEESGRDVGVETLLIPVSWPLNERRQCVLGRRLEDIRVRHVL